MVKKVFKVLPKSCSAKAFTLVELLMAILIIGIFITMAVPAMHKMMKTTQNNVLINDLRIFSRAFQQYAQENGEYPDDQAKGSSYPTGMAGYLTETSWSRKTPIGGNYDWDKNVNHKGTRYEAVISIKGSKDNKIIVTKERLEEIDELLDDGVLNTGVFRLGKRNAPIYIVSE